MVLDASLLSIIRIVGKSWERSSAFFGVIAIKKGGFGSPSTTVANFTLLNLQIGLRDKLINHTWSVRI